MPSAIKCPIFGLNNETATSPTQIKSITNGAT